MPDGRGDEVGMTTSADAIADLRQRRREIRKELARVRWWRRLIAARRDLTVASLAAAFDAEPDLASTWEALAADAPTSHELAAVIWPAGDRGTARGLDALDDIDARLGSYESRLSANLDSVTARMVDAMSVAR